jgi:ACS family tartrate transporter-like MFS transporter
MHADEAGDDVVARSAMAKVSWRLLPLIGLGYLIAYMDRSNISFASLQMNVELGFSAAVYGLGAGIFFVGYALLEVPSNLLCVRFGPRRWIARIMLTWGLISAGMMFVRTPTQFYVMRFLLGVAEAGFFPGVMLYLAAWFPTAWRGRALSRFYIAAPVGTIVMGGLAGSLLGLGGLLHLAGWQWLFLAEGLPAVALAVALLLFLPDSPDAAAWLSAQEKAWLSRTLGADVAASGASHGGFLRALTDPVVLGIGAAVALTFACSNAIIFSAPKLLVDATGWSVASVGFLIAFGGVTTTAITLFVGWHSDHRNERYLHLAAVIGFTAASAVAMALMTGPIPTVLAYLFFVTAAFSVGMVGVLILADAAHPASRAVSFAALNTIAQVGAFIGPWLWGMAADRTGSFQFGLDVVPFVLAAAIAIVMAMRHGAANAAAATVRPGGA